MTAKEKELLDQALKLPPEARAALAGSLIESLDKTVDEDAEIAWGKEIRKRLDDLDSGRVNTIPWTEARRKILG